MERQRSSGRRGLRVLACLLTALVAVPLVGAPVAGGTAPAVPAGTIYVVRTTVPADTIAVRPDGSGATATGCPGDRTMSATGRRVLVSEPTGETFPAYRGGDVTSMFDARRLVSTDERCGDRVVLTELPRGYALYGASWSPDGSRIAASILRYDVSSGQLLDQGIWAGELGGACGSPLCGFHRAVELPMIPSGAGQGGLVPYMEHALGAPRWSSDGRRVTYGRLAGPAPGTPGIFVADLGAPGSTTVGSDEQVVVPGGAAFWPAFSPVLGDDRIVFVQGTGTRSCYRNDLFVTTSAGGTARRVGTATAGMCQLADPDWSPDGTWFVFDAWSGALSDNQAAYRFRVDGSGKVVPVLSERHGSLRLPTWRR